MAYVNKKTVNTYTPMLEFKFERQANAAILRIESSMLTALHNTTILAQLDAIIQEGHNHLVVVLSGVQYMNSSGLSLLVSCHTKTSKAGGKAILCNVPASVNTLLDITKLHSILEQEQTLEAALARF